MKKKLSKRVSERLKKTDDVLKHPVVKQIIAEGELMRSLLDSGHCCVEVYNSKGVQVLWKIRLPLGATTWRDALAVK